MSSQLLKITIQRGNGQHIYDEDFDVPAYENQTILDVVSWIQQNADPALSYRFACRVGMCGSCAMMVNDVPRWTCRTHVARVVKGNAIHIAPLRNLPIIKDLAVDTDPFFDKWIAAEGVHHESRSRADDIQAINPVHTGRVTADAGIECINCAVCYAACDTVAGNPDYLGPAALQRAWTLINDVKDAGRASILNAVSGADGCFNCHSMGSCTAFCPNELDPLSAIAGLKRETSRKMFRRR